MYEAAQEQILPDFMIEHSRVQLPREKLAFDVMNDAWDEKDRTVCAGIDVISNFN
jgi:hypothetical protein